MLRLLGAVLCTAAIASTLLGLQAAWSLWGWCWILVLGLGGAGLVARRARLTGAALAIALLSIAVRGIATDRGAARLHTLPGASTARWTARLIDEQDLALLGTRWLLLRWPLRGDERERLLPTLREAYVELRSFGGTVSSPVIDTLLARQTPGAFDAIEIEPKTERSTSAVLFLHGYAGNALLECWLMARAASPAGLTTLCPSTSFVGRWTDRDGVATVDASLARLRSQGFHRIYLAGLSNGGVGAGVLARRFASQLRGLILISGAPSQGDGARLPTLVLQGELDPMASSQAARAFATRSGGRYVGLRGGHFVLLTDPGATRSLASWFQAQESS